MMRQMHKASAMTAMGQNRAAEHREKQVADLMQVCRDSAALLVELSAEVVELRDRVAKLEGAS